ncbi:MAG: GNAT family N-acetyltransferase [Candidatus Saccharibacteria bacterium]|nr:GNAT family N-acetyltransferase [Candidatus Saccharibacteria bacterium]
MSELPVKSISYETLTNPTLEFSILSQQIGYVAWSERFTQRTDEDIRRMFTQDEPALSENAHKSLLRMQDRARHGVFSGVIARLRDNPIGSAWATDDRSISPQQAELVDDHKPYAWIPHINVLPETQGHGIGKELLKHVLLPFDADQKPTAYVFEENQLTLGMFQKLGFVPKPTKPRIKYDYFGEDNEPVEQWRLEAPSVSAVLKLLK